MGRERSAPGPIGPEIGFKSRPALFYDTRMPFAADPPPLPARAQALLDFWFGPPEDPQRLHHRQIWFRGTPEFDAF